MYVCLGLKTVQRVWCLAVFRVSIRVALLFEPFFVCGFQSKETRKHAALNPKSHTLNFKLAAKALHGPS